MSTQSEKNAFDELNRIINIVARSRYNAQRRLLAHAGFSQITLALSSLALIIIPLLDLGGFNLNYSPKNLQISQIIFAVVLLVDSLLISLGHFEIRAHQMHNNGIVLSRILRELKPLLGNDVQSHKAEYDDLATRYYDCLEKGENHREVDYHRVLLHQIIKNGISKDIEGLRVVPAGIGYFKRILTKAFRVYFIWSLVFSHYCLTIAGIYTWIFFMVYSPSHHPWITNPNGYLMHGAKP